MERLLAEVNFVVKAAAININGENSILVANEETAATSWNGLRSNTFNWHLAKR